MKIIVVDLELNQPSKRIIQIGAVCTDLKTGATLSEFNQYINPEEYLDPFIINLTGITQKQVDEGFKIQDSLQDFWNWCVDNKCKNVQGWGNDVWILLQETKKYGLNYPKIRPFNIKEIANIVKAALPSSSSKGGLMSTLTTFNITFEGKHHNALHDAKNTARLVFFIKEQFKQIFEIKKVIK